MKRIILSIIICIHFLSIYADVNLPAKCEAFLPISLSNAIVLKESMVDKLLNSNDFEQSNKPSDPKHWIAYSDRSENATYQSPNIYSPKFKELDLNECVYIAKIKDDWALVYKEPKIEVYPRISASAESLGWIPMKNLLLWNTALANEAGIYKKALIVANIDKSMNQDLGALYINPVSKIEGGRLRSSMNFFFVLKKDKESGLVLIARQSQINGVNQLMYGWVNENSFAPWNQRSCLEPNWDLNDYAVLKSTSAFIYSDLHLKNKVYTLNYNSLEKRSNVETDDIYKNRWDPGALRYPILDNDSDNKELYKCTTFGLPGGTVGGTDDDPHSLQVQIYDMRVKLEKLVSTVNLLFVIDGTSSMEAFYPAVKQAIRECKYFQKDYDFKVGLVIYRDYADGEKGLVEYLPVRKYDDELLMSYLDKGGLYGIKSSPNDRTHTEALYKGLETALDCSKMGYKKEEANVMVIIGDCGNATDDNKALKSNQLVEKLVENEIQMLAFQVRNLNQRSFLLFNDQLLTLILGNVRQQYTKLYQGIRPKMKEVKGGYDLDVAGGENRRVASIRYASNNSVMQPSELTKLLDQQLRTFAEMLKERSRLVSEMEFIIEKKENGYSSSFAKNLETDKTKAALDSAEIIHMMVKTGSSEDEARRTYRNIQLSNTMVSFTGYTKKKSEGDRDYWKPVVFISVQEFQELMARLSGVYTVARLGKLDRVPYVTAMKGILKSIVPGITDEEMDRLGIEEVMRMVNGLNESTQALNDYTLLEITDKNVVSDAKYRELLSRFRGKYQKLQHIKSSYDFKLQINGVTYYWLPMEDLP